MPSSKNKRLPYYGYRYLTFSSSGRPLDEIEFEGQPLKNKGGPFKKETD